MPYPLHYGGGAIALCGCEKVAQADLNPKARPTTQTLEVPPAASQSPAQAAWLRFVDRVERGEVVDPSGQYVAKGTRVAADASGHRATGPKFNAATPLLSPHYRLLADGSWVGVGVATGTETSVDGPIDFCEGCDTGTGQYYPPVTTTFISSEGVAPYSGSDNPNGYIYDLKIGYGSSPGDHYGIPNSYTVLYSDLNKGAGGDYIYIGFNRAPSTVSENPEIIYGDPYAAGPVTVLSEIRKSSFFDRWPSPGTYFYPGWVDTGRRLGFEQHDLNEGAGGVYIRAYQSKYPGGNPVEIGVLSGNSDTIQPPTGWTKASRDLNEGARGNYIYFCVKAH